MDEKTNFIKIRVFLLNSPLITSNWILQERNRQEEEYYNPEEQIREKIILSINDKIGLSKAYHNIGTTYNYLGKYEESVDFYNKADSTGNKFYCIYIWF